MVVVITEGNGSCFSTVRLPFDPERGKGTVYQTGTNLQAPGIPIPPCVIPLSKTTTVCTQILPFQARCETEGGPGMGPQPTQRTS